MRRVALAIGMLAEFALGASARAADSSVAGDVQLQLATRNNQTVFHVGEVITLQLAYSLAAGSRQTYAISNNSYDRSGRLAIETYHVEPSTGWDDPLKLYFQSFPAILGGGLYSTNKLTRTPVIILRDLNEWVRFDAPGAYRVGVMSTRVQPADRTVASTPLEVYSNEISLQVIPATPAWQAQALHDALSTLDKPSTALRTIQSGESFDRQRADAVLRYLGTPGAAVAMADRLNDDASNFQFMLGLAATPAQSAAYEHMQQLLRDPLFPINDIFLQTLSLVALPPDVVSNRPDQRLQLQQKFEQDLFQALTTKNGKALAVSAYTLITAAGLQSRQLSPDDKRELTTQLTKVFESLSLDDQASLLEYRWQNLDKQAMLPLLPKIAQRYSDYANLRETPAPQANQLSATALLRWYEMDPAQARPAVIAEIVRPKPRYGQEVLGILDDKNLPEVEQQLADHLTAEAGSEEQIASLIFRYGSADIESQVIAYFAPRVGKMACAIQVPLLAYMLRVDSAAAASLLQRAMEARGPGCSACNQSLLMEVALLHNDPMLQDMAIASLNDPEPQVAGNAAAYLGNFGTSSTEPALWARLDSWSSEWKGREAELHYTPGKAIQGVDQEGFGTNLIDAIATAQAWLTSEAELERLLALSVTAYQRQHVLQMLDTWREQPKKIDFVAVGQGLFYIAQYQTKSLQAAIEKLKQFPPGSQFVWVDDDTDKAGNSMLIQLKKASETSGITITLPSSREPKL